jgi:hypothetical protein
MVDEVAEGALQFQGFGGEGAGGSDGAGVFVAQCVKAGGGQRLLLAPEALCFADPGVGVQVGQGENLVAGLFDALFYSRPVEQSVPPGQGPSCYCRRRNGARPNSMRFAAVERNVCPVRAATALSGGVPRSSSSAGGHLR